MRRGKRWWGIAIGAGKSGHPREWGVASESAKLGGHLEAELVGMILAHVRQLSLDIHNRPRLLSRASALGFRQGGGGFSLPSVIPRRCFP
jgi:hypothetical protein